jgi:hypothetical protein
MRKSMQAGLGLLALVGAAALPAGAQEATATATPWLHVRVEEAKDASKVAVNLPLSVVEAVLRASPEMIERHGRIHLGRFDDEHHGVKLADMRRVWKELKDAGDAELVTVESEDENVKVQRKGNLVLVLVDQKPRTDKDGKVKHAGEQVRVEVPVSVVDALLSGEGDEANVEAAVLELRKQRGDIVRVQDDDSHVRVWIDEQNTQPPTGK